MGKITKKLLSALVAAVMVCAMLPISAFAAEGDVAQIGETTYQTLDEAVKAAADGDTITLLNDASVGAFSIPAEKTISIAGEDKAITLTGSVTLNGGLYIKNCDINTAYRITLNKDAVLDMANVKITMDGTTTYKTFANGVYSGYYDGAIALEAPSTLNFDACDVTIYNYYGSGIRWDWESSGYGVNIKNGSTFDVSKCYAGFTGTQEIEILNSTVNIHDNRGNGSNGSHYLIENSTVNFSNNGSHGLSTGRLIVKNSTVTADNNGYNGIVFNNTCTIDKDSKVTVTRNAKSVVKGAFRLLGANAKCTIEKGADVTISNNYASGIQVDNASGVLDMQSGVVMNNVTNGSSSTMGGGIYNLGTATLSDDVVLYNNHATNAGDDIYNTGTITFSETKDGWQLDGEPDCYDAIDGWYDDAADARWEAHAKVNSKNHTELVEAGTLTGIYALKAAHTFDEDAKTSYPSAVKTIVNADGTESNTTSIGAGDSVNFKLTSNVPQDLTNYLEPDTPNKPSAGSSEAESGTDYEPKDENRGKYALTFVDTMDSALNLNEGSIKVTVGDTELAENQYTVNTEPEEGTFTVSLDLVKLYNEKVFTADDFGIASIVVTYTATASDNLTPGTYKNTVKVTYEGGETEESTVTVKTYGIKIFKYDQADNEGLAGAKFTLKLGDVVIKKDLPSDADGYVTIDGLNEGTYTLTETAPPEGYVMSKDPITVTLATDADAETYYATVNFANSLVPHTGGAGTRMYTILGGAILLLAAGVFVATRRKRAN